MSCASPASALPKHTAMIVTLVSGLLAVAVTAGVVMLATQGRGTDNLVSPHHDHARAQRQRHANGRPRSEQRSAPDGHR